MKSTYDTPAEQGIRAARKENALNQLTAPEVGDIIETKNDDLQWLSRKVRAVKENGWFETQSGRQYRVDQINITWRMK